MKQFDRKPTVEGCKAELEAVAKDLGLPLEDPKVPVEWCKRGGWYDDEVAEKLITPLYLVLIYISTLEILPSSEGFLFNYTYL